MPFDDINVGTTPNDGTGDTLRATGQKVNANFDKAVEGPASAVDNRVASFDGVTGKLIQDSGLTFMNIMGAVAHGNDINAARVATLFVYWYGTLPPENAVDGDLWMDASV
jgi:hypothetical protein